MPSTVAQVTKRLADAIPLSKAAAWDSVGLQVGDPQAAASVVGVCHEVSSDVINAAAAAKVGVLVAYHPLLFGPAKSFVAGSSPSGRAHRLAGSGIALYVVHTAYDVVAGGCADTLAETLGLSDIAGFGPNWPADAAKIVTFVPPAESGAIAAAMASGGAGTIGGYSECSFSIEGIGSYRPGEMTRPLAGTAGELSSEPEVRVEMNAPASAVDAIVAALLDAHPYDEPAFDVYPAKANAGFVGRVGRLAKSSSLDDFSEGVGTALDSSVRFAGKAATRVERVAVVPGSGSSLIGAAAQAGVDVLVTGDVSHHRAVEALSSGLAIVDAGHAATERPGIGKLYSLVTKLFDDVVDLTDHDPSPWEGE